MPDTNDVNSTPWSLPKRFIQEPAIFVSPVVVGPGMPSSDVSLSIQLRHFLLTNGGRMDRLVFIITLMMCIWCIIFFRGPPFFSLLRLRVYMLIFLVCLQRETARDRQLCCVWKQCAGIVLRREPDRGAFHRRVQLDSIQGWHEVQARYLWKKDFHSDFHIGNVNNANFYCVPFFRTVQQHDCFSVLFFREMWLFWFTPTHGHTFFFCSFSWTLILSNKMERYKFSTDALAGNLRDYIQHWLVINFCIKTNAMSTFFPCIEHLLNPAMLL